MSLELVTSGLLGLSDLVTGGLGQGLDQSFTDTPSVLLSFVGTSTTWTSGSTVSITNQTGTLSVTAGTWTCTSNTAATLSVSGTGTGTFTVTIDTVESPTITVTGGTVSTATGSCLLMGF